MTSTDLLFKSEKGEELKKELGFPEGYEHVCVVALGYRDENPPAKPRRKDVITDTVNLRDILGFFENLLDSFKFNI
jgi:hypothetical protein